MNDPSDKEEWNLGLEQIMLDPLSYIHPQRLCLSRSITTPRQHAVVNEMLLSGLLNGAEHLTLSRYASQHTLLRYWRQLPYVCSLVGAQLLKAELAWRGRLLHLPSTVRFFMTLPLQAGMVTVTESISLQQDAPGSPVSGICEQPLLQVQRTGLCHLLNWQQAMPSALLARLRLLFSPELDVCFDSPRQPAKVAELFLLSQAIQYAKNYPDNV